MNHEEDYIGGSMKNENIIAFIADNENDNANTGLLDINVKRALWREHSSSGVVALLTYHLEMGGR